MSFYRTVSQREYEEGERAGKWGSMSEFWEVQGRRDPEQELIQYKRRRQEQDRVEAANELAANIELAAVRFCMEMGH